MLGILSNAWNAQQCVEFLAMLGIPNKANAWNSYQCLEFLAMLGMPNNAWNSII